jgi:hypothetical protein
MDDPAAAKACAALAHKARRIAEEMEAIYADLERVGALVLIRRYAAKSSLFVTAVLLWSDYD